MALGDDLPLASKPAELLEFPDVRGTLVAIVKTNGDILFRWDAGMTNGEAALTAMLIGDKALELLKGKKS